MPLLRDTTHKEPKKLKPIKVTVMRRKIERKTTDPKRCAQNRRPALEKVARRMGVLNANNVERVRIAADLRGQGATWAELEQKGYFYAEIRSIAQLSEELNTLFNSAEKLFKGSMAARIESKIIERALNPAQIPVIGWHDGEANFAEHPETGQLICKERDNTAVLLAAAKAFHPDFKETAAGGNIGQQIVYNIQIGGNGAEQPPNPSVLIDAQDVIATESRGVNP